MSSPQILTFTQVPQEQARAGNREECLHYLAEARAVQGRLAERSQRLAELGRIVDAPALPSLEEAEQTMWAKFGPDDDGSEAVRSIHQYYQSLKHPWSDRLDEEERALAEQSHQEREAASEMARLRQLEAQLVQNADAVAAHDAAAARAAQLQVDATEQQADLATQTREVSAVAKAGQWIVELSTEEKIRRKVAAILATATSEDELELLRIRIATLGTPDSPTALAHLEHLRLSRNRELAERRHSAVAAEMRERQAAELRVALEASFAACEPMLSALPYHESASHRQALAAAVARCDALTAAQAEAEFAVARRSLQAAAARRPAVIAMVRELLALGYQEVTPMETVTAADLNARGVSTIQLGLPSDPERLAEISFTPDAATVAVQAVRNSPADGTAEQRAADVAAQTALCADVDRVRRSAALQAHQPQVLKREDPGKAMPARATRVRRRGVFATGAAGAAPAAQQSRALPG